MKKILLLLICLTTLESCNQIVEERVITLNDDEKNLAITTLQLYQNKNSLNMVHLDSVVNYGVDLIKENKGKELANLLDKELSNFYASPSNTIDNEIKLHKLICALYCKQTTYEILISKSISLNEHTVMHIESQGSNHPEYAEILEYLLTYHIIKEDDKSIMKNYSKAILAGRKLSTHALQTDNKDAQIYSSLLLAYLYEMNDAHELKDSCINSIEHIIPLYPESEERAWQFLNR